MKWKERRRYMYFGRFYQMSLSGIFLFFYFRLFFVRRRRNRMSQKKKWEIKKLISAKLDREREKKKTFFILLAPCVCKTMTHNISLFSCFNLLFRKINFFVFLFWRKKFGSYFFFNGKKLYFFLVYGVDDLCISYLISLT